MIFLFLDRLFLVGVTKGRVLLDSCSSFFSRHLRKVDLNLFLLQDKEESLLPIIDGSCFIIDGEWLELVWMYNWKSFGLQKKKNLFEFKSKDTSKKFTWKISFNCNFKVIRQKHLLKVFFDAFYLRAQIFLSKS